MIVQLILTTLFVLLFAAGLLLARRLRLLGIALSVASAAAVLPVWLPDWATEFANLLGVGRGADLLLYLWFTISVLLMLALYLRLMRVQDQLTELVRQLAIHEHERAGDHEVRR